jgi:hypothetical protein
MFVKQVFYYLSHTSVSFFISFLSQGVTMKPRLALNSRSSCFGLLSAGITGILVMTLRVEPSFLLLLWKWLPLGYGEGLKNFVLQC